MTIARQCWCCYWHPVSCVNIKSYPSSTSAKNSFRPHPSGPHSWPSLETVSCVPSLSSTTRQPSCHTSWFGLGWRRNCWCLYSPCREYRSRDSLAGVVVEVLGIRILNLLANLQCGRWRMTFMLGSGRSQNRQCSLCGKKETPLDSILSQKLKNLHVTADRVRQWPGSRCLFNGWSWPATVWVIDVAFITL